MKTEWGSTLNVEIGERIKYGVIEMELKEVLPGDILLFRGKRHELKIHALSFFDKEAGGYIKRLK